MLDLKSTVAIVIIRSVCFKVAEALLLGRELGAVGGFLLEKAVYGGGCDGEGRGRRHGTLCGDILGLWAKGRSK